MNTMTRTYQTRAIQMPRTHWTWRAKLLLILIVISAFSVVYVKDFNRRLFIEYENLSRANQQAQVQWGKLMLEQSTWSAQANVQQLAQKQLHMLIPASRDVILLADE